MTTFHDSLWSATASQAPPCAPLSGNEDADVVVVGAGYTGLSAALHLAREGKRVIVLEAEEPGFGCSGRNGGQVNPGSTRMLPSELRKTLGDARGERFIKFGAQSADLVFALIERYDIECEARRPGYVQGGYGARGRKLNEGWAREWGARGVAVEVFERDELATLTGTSAYGHGLLDPRGGSVQPLSYARGLARAALAEGASISGKSEVRSIAPRGAGWRVHTATAEVSCAHVLLATNGYTGDLWPRLRESIIPVTSFLVASKPLSDNLRGSVLPGRHAVSETARVLFYYRVDDAGRLIIGGHGNRFDTREHGRDAHVRAAATRLFPQLGDIEWEHRWAGWPAMTPNHTPHLFRLARGVHAGLGYNGRGVASATLMGAQLAHVVLDDAEPLIDVMPLQRFPLHAFSRVGAGAFMLASEAGDRLDMRQGAA